MSPSSLSEFSTFRADRLSYTHGSKRDASPLFRNISFSCKIGDRLWVRGANGAGKSTLLSILASLQPPGNGSILVDNEDIFRSIRSIRNYRKLIGFSAGAPNGFYSRLDGLTNLMFFNSLGRERPEKEVHDVVERVGLAGAKRELYGNYSLGMRQRLHVARVMLGGPIWILDEPTNGLDSEGNSLLRGLCIEHRGLIIFTAHDVEFAQNIASCEVRL